MDQSFSTQNIINNRHIIKMRKRKEFHEKNTLKKQQKKGLLIVHTGRGKGKSTAAFGMVFRALAHGMRVGIVQFIKGSRSTGERLALEKFGKQSTIFANGIGFTWEIQDRNKDIKLAKSSWRVAKNMILNKDYDMVLCDELNVVLRYGYLSMDEVLKTLKNRSVNKHVIITGRNADPNLVLYADLVTDMVLIKHPFKNGIQGQKGIEF